VSTFMYITKHLFLSTSIYENGGDVNAIHENNSMLLVTLNDITLFSIKHSLPMFVKEKFNYHITQQSSRNSIYIFSLF
jgi:hypothetical protein